MDNQAIHGGGTILEIRAWKIRGTEKVLVAERVRDKDGSQRMIWHVPVADVQGFLWLEQMGGTAEPSAATWVECGAVHKHG